MDFIGESFSIEIPPITAIFGIAGGVGFFKDIN